jgi:acyl-CoA synthetase (AMP-forming)/AMP-acid ligase II
VDGLDQEIVAIMVPKTEAVISEAELRSLSNEALSSYKRPQRYIFITREDVPLSGTAKPQRRALAELAGARLRGAVNYDCPNS